VGAIGTIPLAAAPNRAASAGLAPCGKGWTAVTGRDLGLLLDDWAGRRRLQLGLALRVTVAATLTLAIARAAKLPLPLWAVLTAVIVTQASVGRSLRATIDYLFATLGGVVYGGTIAVLVPHESEVALLAVLALAVAPLALVAAINSRLAAAPITAIIVVLLPTITHTSALASAWDRLLEVSVGGATGLVVSFLLLPSRAHGQALAAAAQSLEEMASVLRALIAGLAQGLDVDTLHRIQDGVGLSLVRLNAICIEAEDERSAGIGAKPETGPLLRTLLRLRHDLVMLGRATLVPLPEEVQSRLRSPLEHAAAAIAEFLLASGAALRARRGPPPFAAVESKLDALTSRIDTIRSEGLTRGLTAEAAERFFALGFALEQMRHNCSDLARCVSEWVGKSRLTRRARE
jgi:uncharacterized membrane protein YccC